jgi:hypothetical protein
MPREILTAQQLTNARRLRWQGLTYLQIGDKLGVKPGTVARRLNREDKKVCGSERAHTTRALRRLAFRLNMWHFADSGPLWDRDKFPKIRAEIDRFEGVSYAISRVPELEFVCINRVGEDYYGFTQQDLAGMSVWQGISMEPIYSRVVNLEEYHLKCIMAAKGVLEFAEGCGRSELERVKPMLAPYVRFARSHPSLSHLWKELPPDIWAISASYPKIMTYLVDNQHVELEFVVSWSYRPDLKVYKVQYFPEPNTIAETTMWRLVEKVQDEFHNNRRAVRHVNGHARP